MQHSLPYDASRVCPDHVQNLLVHEQYMTDLDKFAHGDTSTSRFDIGLLILNDPIDYITPITLKDANQVLLEMLASEHAECPCRMPRITGNSFEASICRLPIPSVVTQFFQYPAGVKLRLTVIASTSGEFQLDFVESWVFISFSWPLVFVFTAACRKTTVKFTELIDAKTHLSIGKTCLKSLKLKWQRTND